MLDWCYFFELEKYLLLCTTRLNFCPFTIYDLCEQLGYKNCLRFSTNISLADDTNVFIVDKHLQALYEKGNSELENIDNWLIANKLSINANKTNYIIFQTPKSRSAKTTSFQLKLRNNKVEKVSSTRFLGVIINKNLSWKYHRDSL